MTLYALARFTPTCIVTGGEATLGILQTSKDNTLSLKAKVQQISYIILATSLTGYMADYLIHSICPSLFVGRALSVIGAGVIITRLSNSNCLNHQVACLLGTAGRNTFYAGIALTLASGISKLV